MTKRQIKITITPQGELSVNNAGNPDEARILAELAELAELLNGDPTAFKIEKHVHTHGHDHSHASDHIHTGGNG